MLSFSFINSLKNTRFIGVQLRNFSMNNVFMAYDIHQLVQSREGQFHYRRCIKLVNICSGSVTWFLINAASIYLNKYGISRILSNVQHARQAVVCVSQQELVTVMVFSTAPLLPTVALDMMPLLNGVFVSTQLGKWLWGALYNNMHIWFVDVVFTASIHQIYL